ncbi:hypothetical protein OIDMADRAFT_48960 [Oidiodendron maius Zn]|uniref:DUF3328 domain-containing protein n=1 Tax=Oidiodendron maius (strain Zn) TaxID=913774 RepID=A0A0C3HLX8_OIDMZ|nr:hypothetical protein OIDMADRAFT_48960 [Oidiodendron maius Zn]
MLLLSHVKTYISGRYTSLGDAEQRNGDTKFCPQPRGISYQHAVFLYILIVFLVVILVAFLLKDPYIPYNDTLGTYETGWKTEIIPDRNTLTLKRVKFYGGILYGENGTVSLSHRPGEPDYFGPPGVETDHAWSLILRDRFIKIEPQYFPPEAAQLSDQDLVNGTWRLETSGLHVLHCLNYVRQSLSPEHYAQCKDLPGLADPRILTHSGHLRHCLEQIRQHLMCQLDMTPTPRTWRPNVHIHHADTDQWHVCRNFDAMRIWMYPLAEHHT